MLDKLSVEGMSDEEPGTATIGNRTIPVFCVKLCLWRAEAGTSGAPTGLPRKMYDGKWLKQQEEDWPFYVEEELQVSEEAFELLVLVESYATWH